MISNKNRDLNQPFYSASSCLMKCLYRVDVFKNNVLSNE